jgi:hypothetical protein
MHPTKECSFWLVGVFCDNLWMSELVGRLYLGIFKARENGFGCCSMLLQYFDDTAIMEPL